MTITTAPSRSRTRLVPDSHPLRRQTAEAPWIPQPIGDNMSTPTLALPADTAFLNSHRVDVETGPALSVRILTAILATLVAVALISVPVAAIIFAMKFIAPADNTPAVNIPSSSRPAYLNNTADAPVITVAANPTTGKNKKAKKNP